MRPPSPELLIEALAEALQTMAFICPEPADGTAPAPAESERLTIQWSGAGGGAGGELQLATTRQFGELLAASILALEPGTVEAAQRAGDALKELCNITTGSFLARLSETPEDAPVMGLPASTALPDAEAWQQFVAQPHTAILMAEGQPLAVRLEEARA
jgi:hypothetical protein